MKTIIKIISALYLLPGLIFDLCLGLAFIMDDGRTDHHQGDFLAQWAIDKMDLLPDWASMALIPSVFICALPAGLICIGLIIGSIIGIVYVSVNFGLAILNLPFSGKFEWGLF